MGSVTEIVLILVIVLFASMVRGSTGFGLAMVSMPLLSLFLPYKDTVILLVFLNLFFSVFHILRSSGTIDIKNLLLIIIFSITGVSIGVLLFNRVDVALLKAVAGLIIIIFGIALMFGFQPRIKNLHTAFSLASLSGGILAGSASIGGPAAAIILGGTDMKPERFRYAMSLFFLISYSYSTIMYGVSGNINKHNILMLLITVPLMFAGLIIGEKIANNLNKNILRKIVLSLLIVTGTIITIQGISQLL